MRLSRFIRAFVYGLLPLLLVPAWALALAGERDAFWDEVLARTHCGTCASGGQSEGSGMAACIAVAVLLSVQLFRFGLGHRVRGSTLLILAVLPWWIVATAQVGFAIRPLSFDTVLAVAGYFQLWRFWVALASTALLAAITTVLIVELARREAWRSKSEHFQKLKALAAVVVLLLLAAALSAADAWSATEVFLAVRRSASGTSLAGLEGLLGQWHLLHTARSVVTVLGACLALGSVARCFLPQGGKSDPRSFAALCLVAFAVVWLDGNALRANIGGLGPTWSEGRAAFPQDLFRTG